MIIVNEKNADRINAEFKKVEGRARVRTCSYNTVVAYIARIEEHLIKDLRVSKKYINGCKFSVFPFEGTMPKAYKYPAIGDSFSLIYSGNKWRLTGVYREQIGSYKYKIYSYYTQDFINSVIKNNRSF